LTGQYEIQATRALKCRNLPSGYFGSGSGLSSPRRNL
jgi:hypothetical protein